MRFSAFSLRGTATRGVVANLPTVDNAPRRHGLRLYRTRPVELAAAPYREHSRQEGLSSPVDRPRVAEHPRPDHVIAHISDTHLIAGDGDLYGRRRRRGGPII